MPLAFGLLVLSQTLVSGRAALQPCRLPKLDEPALCGSLEVFEDRRARTGRKLTLRVGVLPSTGPRKAPDPLFVLQGGPGQAATKLAEFYGTTFKTLRREREIVLVDQRGTGDSNPLECALHGDGSDLDRLLGPWFPIAEVKACRERLAASTDLTLYSTPLAMQDLDDVRGWLGYDRINLYGTSYGTLAAQEYLRRYPKRVRSAVLKAVVAPRRDWGVFWAKNTEQAFERIASACAADSACRQAHPDPRSDLASVLERLGKGPLPVEISTPDGSKARVQLTRSAAVAALRAALGAPATAVGLPRLLHQAAAGNFTDLTTAALQFRRTMGPELSEGMFFTVMCSELIGHLDAKALARESAGTLIGEEPMRELMSACAEWPRSAPPRDLASPPTAEIPVLLISGRLDPSTPPENGDDLARDLRNARHLVVPNGGHSFNNLGGCVEEIIAAFVAKGSVAGLDTSCAERIVLPPFALPAP